MDFVEDVGRPGAIAAAPPAVLLFATTVMALGFAAPAAAPADVELVGKPAWMVTALVEVELVGRPAATVVFPPDACTVTALPAALVVVAATSPSWVNPDVLIDAAAEVELAAATAPGFPGPATTVMALPGAAAVEFAAATALEPPVPATTVIGAAAAGAPAVELPAAAVAFPPEPASTVMALAAALVVVAATRPS